MIIIVYFTIKNAHTQLQFCELSMNTFVCAPCLNKYAVRRCRSLSKKRKNFELPIDKSEKYDIIISRMIIILNIKKEHIR